MNATFRSLLSAAAAIAVLATSKPVAASEPKGLLIYTDHPSTYVEASEFLSLDTGKNLYSTIVRPDGQQLQIQNGGLWIEVDYPPPTPDVDITEAANRTLSIIQTLLPKYPQFKAQLLAARSKWQNALAAYKLLLKNNSANTITLATVASLEIDGVTYQNVTLTSVEENAAGISHDSGVATIPLAKLTKEQIVTLNTTSTSIRIDPDWAAKKQGPALSQNQGASEIPKAVGLPKNIQVATKEKPFVNSLGMKFVPVPGTNVLFSIWDTRVQDCRAFIEANPDVDAPYVYTPKFALGENYPALLEEWEQARAFCAWLTQKERKEGKIGQDQEYRLPTDKEWSIAVGESKYPPQLLRDVRRVENGDGSGDLIMERVVSRHARGRNFSTEHGFIAVRDVKGVEAMVRKLAAG